MTATSYDLAARELAGQVEAWPQGAPLRLAKRTSNLFRDRAPATTPGLDVSGWRGVLDVDVDGRTADVLGMTTYEELVDATLAHGLMPLVVPQLKTITLGGAVAGLGIEASSFRNGCPHESVLEMDVLTGAGRVVTCSREQDSALFHGFPNSYGTLGYALRLRIELEPVLPFVHLRHVRCGSVAQAAALMTDVCAAGSYDGEPVAFVDAVWFGPDDTRVTLGSWASAAPHVSDYTGREIYYRSLRQRPEDWLTVRDYLWRWDTDWFWCSRAFGAQHPVVRRIWPRRWLRSDVYWALVAFERRHGWKSALDRRRGLPEREDVVQDVEVPVDRVANFMDVFAGEVPIEPVWFCPLRQRGPDDVWDLYRLDPSVLYVNVGFWSSVALGPGEPDGTHNRLVERLVGHLGGRKSLYSTSYYDEEAFWRLYNGPVYRRLKDEHDPQARFLDLYEKCVRGG